MQSNTECCVYGQHTHDVHGNAGIAMGLGLPQSFFEGQRSGRDQSYWCTRVIHYPPLAEGTSHRSAFDVCYL